MNSNTVSMLAGALFVLVGIWLMRKQIKAKKNNTEAVTAHVVNYYTEVNADTNDGADTVAYYPIMNYYYGGQTYEKQSNSGSSRKKYAIGEEVEILINPDNPDDFSIPGDKSGYIISIGFMVAGVLAIVLPLTANNF